MVTLESQKCRLPGAIKVVEKERSDEFTYSNEYWSDGVRPRGLKVLADVLAKALADIGVQGVSVQRLRK